MNEVGGNPGSGPKRHMPTVSERVVPELMTLLHNATNDLRMLRNFFANDKECGPLAKLS